MKKLKNILMLVAVAGLTAFYFWSNKSDAVVVYAIYDQSKLGEVNMVMSVAEAVPQICKNHAFLTYVPDFKKLSKEFDQTKTNLVVTAGKYGIDFLKTTETTKNVKFLLCVHQWFDIMKDLHDISVVMPKHAINDDLKAWAKKQNIQLIPTQGVLHRMSAKAISAEDTTMIHLKDAKVGIVLGGDAEMPNGKDWKLFSEKNVHEFGLQVCEFLKKTGYKVLVTNGPRTGAFIDSHNRNPNAHKDGKLDKISKTFLNTLITAGFKQGEHFEFFDFQFGKPSALKEIMATVYKNKGFLIMPGESTSSISESIAVMPTVVYKVDSMNDAHQAYLDDLIQSRVAIIWPDVFDEAKSDYLAPESQALLAVKVLLKG